MQTENHDNQIALLENIQNMLQIIKNSTEGTQIDTKAERLRAAYALNLCTVSVSQIIDFDDIYILDQEYDAILNNLNLEVMPKDEALLDILKQLLNTITFFKIQEGDKHFLELEYQQKMKNAIWSAVPNLAVIGMGGTPLSIGVSLAAQVGIGYMNYRHEKANSQLERDQERWKLRKSAMEQFNGLRRELFDTAWRLADKYQFPDEYRITEHQIARYNAALTDPDHIRQYERLQSMADKFEAYPPFWYFLGHAANMIAQDQNCVGEIQEEFRKTAAENYEKFLKLTEENLLREDQLLASCALEYFDLLNVTGGDRAKMEGLLRRALHSAGNMHDVMELTAIAYMKLGDYKEASHILRILVNEDYNKTVNAQLLSHIYVSEYMRNPDTRLRYEYDTLSGRVHPGVLYPMPEPVDEGGNTEEKLQKRFVQQQRQLLVLKYVHVLNNMMLEGEKQFEKSIPIPVSCVTEDREADCRDKYLHINEIIGNDQKNAEYCYNLSGFSYRQMDALNAFYDQLCHMPGIHDYKDEIFNRIEDRVSISKRDIDAIDEAINNQKLTPREVDLLVRRNFTYYVKHGISEAVHQICTGLEGLERMSEFSDRETALRNFCIQYGLPIAERDDTDKASSFVQLEKQQRRINLAVLFGQGKDAQARENARSAMADAIRSVKENGLISSAKPIKLYLPGDPEYSEYCSRYHKKLSGDFLAILNDTSLKDTDLIFTVQGVLYYGMTVTGKRAEGPTKYTAIKLSEDRPGLKIGKHNITYKTVDDSKMKDLIGRLADIERQYFPAGEAVADRRQDDYTAWLNQKFAEADTASIENE